MSSKTHGDVRPKACVNICSWFIRVPGACQKMPGSMAQNASADGSPHMKLKRASLF
jgi:hypothetical protein